MSLFVVCPRILARLGYHLRDSFVAICGMSAHSTLLWISCERQFCRYLWYVRAVWTGAILWHGLGNGSRKLVWSSLGPFSSLGSEMVPGSLFGVLWGHFLGWARKWLQEACLEFSGAIFWPGLGNCSRKLVWSSLGQFSGLGSEIAPGSLFGALWGDFLAWARKSFQETCLEVSGAISWPGLGNGSRKLVWSSLGSPEA